MCDNSEEQNRQYQGHSDYSCKSICSQIMRRYSERSSSVIFYERCSILLFLLARLFAFIVLLMAHDLEDE